MSISSTKVASFDAFVEAGSNGTAGSVVELDLGLQVWDASEKDWVEFPEKKIRDKKLFFALLPKFTSLNTLIIAWNGLGPEGAKALAPSLMGLLNLTSLDLSFNGLGPEGAKALAPSLMGLLNLTSLNLSGNGLGPEGAKALAPSLMGLLNLTSLDLSYNGLGPEGISALFIEGLAFRNEILTVKITNNNSHSASALLNCLRENNCTRCAVAFSSSPEVDPSDASLAWLPVEVRKKEDFDDIIAYVLDLNRKKARPSFWEDRLFSVNLSLRDVLHSSECILKADGDLANPASVSSLNSLLRSARSLVQEIVLKDQPAPDLFRLLFPSHDASLSFLLPEIQGAFGRVVSLLQTRASACGSLVSCLEAQKLLRSLIFTPDQDAEVSSLASKRNQHRADFVSSIDAMVAELNVVSLATPATLTTVLSLLTSVAHCFNIPLPALPLDPASPSSSSSSYIDRLSSCDPSEVGSELLAILAEVVELPALLVRRHVEGLRASASLLSQDALSPADGKAALKSELAFYQSLSTISCARPQVELLCAAVEFVHYLAQGNLLTLLKDLCAGPSAAYLHAQYAKMKEHRANRPPTPASVSADEQRALHALEDEIPLLKFEISTLETKLRRQSISSSPLEMNSPELKELRDSLAAKEQGILDIKSKSRKAISSLRAVMWEHFPEELRKPEFQKFYGLPGDVKFLSLDDFSGLKELSNQRHLILRGKRAGQDFALKRFSTEAKPGAFNEQERRAMLKEASVLSKLKHPFIIQLAAVADSPDAGYLVFPLYPHDLDQYIKAHHQAVTEPMRLSICKKVLVAIDYLHENKIVHMDIKPANVFLSTDGREVVLADFDGSQDLAQTLVSMGAMGTLMFASPEATDCMAVPSRLRTIKPSFDSDMFSFGAMLHYILQYSDQPSPVTSYCRSNIPPLSPKLQCSNYASAFICDELLSREDRKKRPTARQALMHRLFDHIPIYTIPDDGLPSYFVHRADQGFQLVDVTAEFGALIEGMMNETSDPSTHSTGADSHKEKFKSFRVQSVNRVENAELWLKYSGLRKAIIKRTGQQDPCSAQKIATYMCPSGRSLHEVVSMNHGGGECLLFHATTPGALDAISLLGFDSRIDATSGRMLGHGVYFAENSSKADQYAKNPEKDHFMFLSRVLIGDPFHLLQTCSQLDLVNKLKRPPCKDRGLHVDCRCAGPLYDSLLFQTTHQDPNGFKYRFREVVVYDGQHCYPEFLIRYTRE